MIIIAVYDTKLISADNWKADQIGMVLHHYQRNAEKLTENGPSEKFKKQVYQMRDNQNYTIVHYIGDHSLIKHSGVVKGGSGQACVH